MACRAPRAEIILPVVFAEDLPRELCEAAAGDLGEWVNVLVSVIPYLGDLSALTALSTVDHLREVSVTCALEALLASPVAEQ